MADFEQFFFSQDESFEFDYEKTSHAPSKAYQSPEHRLQLAVLEDAFHVLTETKLKTDVQKRNYRETLTWLHSPASAPVFSFIRICEDLGFDPSYVRKGIVKAMEEVKVYSGTVGHGRRTDQSRKKSKTWGYDIE